MTIISVIQISVLLPTFVSFVVTRIGADHFQKIENEPCVPVEEEQVEVCLRPMLNYATTLQNNGLLPLEGVQVFQKLCDLYSDFSECAKKIGCTSVSMNAMDASYGYMCGDGFFLFSKHVDCFAEVENQQKYLKCKNTATTGVNQLQFDSGYPNDYLNSLCNVMQTYLQCSKPIILSRCGKEAWNLVKRVTKDSLKVTMPECNLKSTLNEDK